MTITRTDLRHLVDHVWSTAKESTEVPGTPEADRMIDHALAVEKWEHPDVMRWRWLVEQISQKDTMVRAQALLWNASPSRREFVRLVDEAMKNDAPCIACLEPEKTPVSTRPMRRQERQA